MKTPDFPHIQGVRFAHVPNHLGYAVSDDGRLWSCRYNRWGLANLWRELATPVQNKYGRRLVRLGRARVTYLHTVMLESFVGPRPDGMECLHSNSDANDNRLCNLRWGTREDNIADVRVAGKTKGEKHYAAKLTADLVREIRRRAAQGETHQSIADRIGIERGTASKVIRGERWAHVQ